MHGTIKRNGFDILISTMPVSAKMLDSFEKATQRWKQLPGEGALATDSLAPLAHPNPTDCHMNMFFAHQKCTHYALTSTPSRSGNTACQLHWSRVYACAVMVVVVMSEHDRVKPESCLQVFSPECVSAWIFVRLKAQAVEEVVKVRLSHWRGGGKDRLQRKYYLHSHFDYLSSLSIFLETLVRN